MATTDLQSLVDALKSIIGKYSTEEENLCATLDNVHHAYVMREYGENKQLQETIEHLKALVIAYDSDKFAITFNLNGGTGVSAPTSMTACKWNKIKLPSLTGVKAPIEGEKFYGWCQNASGSREYRYYYPEEEFEVLSSTTFYALWGPDYDYTPSDGSETEPLIRNPKI